jgi:hypothetical protein
MPRDPLPDCDGMLLCTRIAEEPRIAVAVVDIFSGLSAGRRMHIENDVEILLVRPLDNVIQQSETFGVVGLEELVMKRHAD